MNTEGRSVNWALLAFAFLLGSLFATTVIAMGWHL
jgi:hypothetical protein